MALYKVINAFAFVMNKPQLLSKPLGILIKNDIIEVIKFYNNWAYFKYNDKDAYTPSYNLAELTRENKQRGFKNNEDADFYILSPSMISSDISSKDSKET